MTATSQKRTALLIALGIFTAGYAAGSFLLKPGFTLTAFGDVGQCIIQTGIVVFMAINLNRQRNQATGFWWMMTIGSALWLVAQVMWTYYECVLRVEVPSAYIGDLMFFLHVVPFIAATTLRPHVEPSESSRRFDLGYLDFALLMVWWVFLYGYVVGPWQVVHRNEGNFGFQYDVLFAIENMTVLLGFAVRAWLTRGPWKRMYVHLLGASGAYALSSLVLNMAINRKAYYTGCFYDIPLIMSMGWFCYAGYLGSTSELSPQPAEEDKLTSQTYWHARLAAIAMFSTPFFAAYAFLDANVPQDVRNYRVLMTLGTMLVLGMMVMWKQDSLQDRLLGLILEAQKSYKDLRRTQDQLLQAEKLAAIGKLVAGAAHEINNPLTAILGYSSLVADDPQLNSVQRSTIGKIIAQARRTKSLVSSLLTFAKQTPMERSILDLNTVINNAIQLHELDRGGQNIKIVRNLQADLPAIWGDKNQLLQTCFHILDNAVEAMQTAQGDGTATLSTGFENGKVIFRCSDTGPGVTDPSKIFDPFYTTKEVGKGSGLGLSACYGIVRDHGGEIKCENRLFGGAEFTLSFPPAEPERQAQAAVAGPVQEHK